jgi:hypothetical protein
VGARVRVYLPTGRTLVRQVDLSNGHTGARAPDLLFGLGDDPSSTLEAEFSWRDRQGKRQTQVLTMTPGWHTVVLGEEGCI